ncbi:PHP domain-containing protein [Streptomyces kaniharaensis]|uniref:PHP domain-containing protein n=1 Tax=Streptomyces kaniharaensis TaxID=212423 RepID=A0A6N7L3V7_9ACTN|nr:PHP domain-containing protein [Streptomyces kaniharaensis]MQS16864.1 PHP domain-containing protein [Streptomyces kaniharaensis]
MEPVEALRRIAFLLEWNGASPYRVRAFHTAAEAVHVLPPGPVDAVRARSLRGVGPVTAEVIAQASAGGTPSYLARLEAAAGPAARSGWELLAAAKGDCHLHSDWSDGGHPFEEMAEAARALGHRWAVLTDHSPRLTIAHGLSAERLRLQLDAVAAYNARTGSFRLLSGIECDILEDGHLDQEAELLGRLDVVVASVHSKLRSEPEPMTARMVAAVRNPQTNVLGHCTGRIVTGRGRPQSRFDAEAVFTACAETGTAVEINCRPERRDPPDDLLGLAAEAGCLFAVDTDAHAPGQLQWHTSGYARAARFGLGPERVVTTWPRDRLLAWAGRAGARG